jgi:NAD(P)-dependent dehydrogenase (short-subunit alcohol dehydrogenase family)
MPELSGKVAIVTGGASGIGRATAERFVEEGARVVVADVDATRGEEVAAALGAAAAFHRTDVSDADAVQALVDFAVERFGGLHVMFNNAGIPSAFATRFLDDPLDDFERVMAVNLYGVVVGSQRAARHMAGHGGGSIVNTSSIAALNAGTGVLSYRLSKTAVIQFTRSIALDLAEHGIRVNCVAPGLIPTAITSYDLDAVRPMIQPLPRPGSARDVAEAVLYLAGDRAAHVTGVVLPVDGGTSVGAPPRQQRHLRAAREQASPG